MVGSNEKDVERKPRTGWFVMAVAATVVGAVTAVVFASYRFTQSGGCGLVRFYEYALGVIVLGVWFAGLAAGMGLATYGFVKRSWHVVPGALVAVVVNCLMLLVCILTVSAIREADYSLKSTDLLLKLLDKGDLDDQNQAAYELGNRRAFEAVSLLCRVLDNKNSDINLRHNAAGAIGKLFAQPRSENAQVDRAVISLVHPAEAYLGSQEGGHAGISLI